MVKKLWINAHLTFFTNETSYFKVITFCRLVKMLESSMIKALTVNALLTFYGLNAAELYNICERTISPRSQTIKPTIQVYKTCSNSEPNLTSWRKHQRKHQRYSLTNVNSTNNDLCWVSSWSRLHLKRLQKLRNMKKVHQISGETICMWLINAISRPIRTYFTRWLICTTSLVRFCMICLDYSDR